MIRVALCLTAITQWPLAVVWSAPPAANRVTGLQYQQLGTTAVAPIQANQLSDPSSEGAPAPDPTTVQALWRLYDDGVAKHHPVITGALRKYRMVAPRESRPSSMMRHGRFPSGDPVSPGRNPLKQ